MKIVVRPDAVFPIPASARMRPEAVSVLVEMAPVLVRLVLETGPKLPVPVQLIVLVAMPPLAVKAPVSVEAPVTLRVPPTVVLPFVPVTENVLPDEAPE